MASFWHWKKKYSSQLFFLYSFSFYSTVTSYSTFLVLSLCFAPVLSTLPRCGSFFPLIIITASRSVSFLLKKFFFFCSFLPYIRRRRQCPYNSYYKYSFYALIITFNTILASSHVKFPASLSLSLSLPFSRSLSLPLSLSLSFFPFPL